MQLGRAITPQQAKDPAYSGLVVRSGNGLYLKPGAADPAITPGSATPTADSITKAFIDQVTPLFAKPNQPTITPFEKSGYFSEADTKALADQEYDPYYAALRDYTNTQNAAQDKNTLETVNAAGGFNSSAYKNDVALRQQQLKRDALSMNDQEAAAKAQFQLNRRNEAYQRYLQGIGAVTT